MSDLLKINGVTIHKGDQSLELTAVELRQLVAVLGNFVPRVPLPVAHLPILIPDHPRMTRMRGMTVDGDSLVLGEGFSVEFVKETVSRESAKELRRVEKERVLNRG